MYRRRRMMQGQVFRGLKIYTDADNTSTFDPIWMFSDASVMTVNWGDGTPQESHATALSHTYAAGSGRKLVRFSCPDWTKLLIFVITDDVCRLSLPSFASCTSIATLTIMANQFAGALPSFASCVGLVDLNIGDNQFTGTLQGFATCPLINNIFVDYNQFSGIIPSFAVNTAMIRFRGNNNAFSGYTAGGFATQVGLLNIWLDVNNLTEAAVDAILADCVTSLAIPARAICTVRLDGVGMAPPSNPAGLASKATLVAAGWTVTTN